MSKKTLNPKPWRRIDVLYAIIAVDHPNSLPARRQARPAHLARLEALRDEGRLILAGPHPAIDSPDPGEAGFTGSLIVAEFSDLAAAEAWAAADPYREAGVYSTVSVKPFKQVFP
nr:YciI family protein [Allochromatium vinosum]